MEGRNLTCVQVSKQWSWPLNWWARQKWPPKKKALKKYWPDELQIIYKEKRQDKDRKDTTVNGCHLPTHYWLQWGWGDRHETPPHPSQRSSVPHRTRWWWGYNSKFIQIINYKKTQPVCTVGGVATQTQPSNLWFDFLGFVLADIWYLWSNG